MDRLADQSQLNPLLYEKYYNDGYTMSVRDYPLANEHKHEFNAERHARYKINQASKLIEEQREAYQRQLNAEYDSMNKPEYKRRLSEYKTNRSRKNIIKELNENITSGKIQIKNGGTQRKHKNNKSKSKNEQMGGRDDHLNQEDLDRIINDLRELGSRHYSNVRNIPAIPDEPNADFNQNNYKVGVRGIVTYKVGHKTVTGRREIANRIDPGYIPQFEYDGDDAYVPIVDGKTVLEELLTSFKYYPDYKLIEQLLDKDGQVIRSKTLMLAMNAFRREDNERVQHIYDKIIDNIRFVNQNNELREIYKLAMESYNVYVVHALFNRGYTVPDMYNMTVYLGKDENASIGDIQKRNAIQAVLNPLTQILYALESKGILKQGLGADILSMLGEQIKNLE